MISRTPNNDMYAYVYNDPLNAIDPTGKWGQYMDPNYSGVDARAAEAKQLGRTATRKAQVATLREGGDATARLSDAGLATAAAGIPSGNIAAISYGAKVSTISGAVSVATHALADVIESGSVSSDTTDAARPMLLGLIVDEGLQSAKVGPGPAKAIAVGIEAVGTLIEVSRNIGASCNEDKCE